MNDEIKQAETAAKTDALEFVNKQKSWVEANAKPLLIGAGAIVLLIVGYLVLR